MSARNELDIYLKSIKIKYSFQKYQNKFQFSLFFQLKSEEKGKH